MHVKRIFFSKATVIAKAIFSCKQQLLLHNNYFSLKSGAWFIYISGQLCVSANHFYRFSLEIPNHVQSIQLGSHAPTSILELLRKEIVGGGAHYAVMCTSNKHPRYFSCAFCERIRILAQKSSSAKFYALPDLD